ncbi:MAG: hypothetical protein PVJ98_11890 [Akkermansiaceae bacterium]
MFDFKLFNIPVRVEPLFWVAGFILGNGLGIDSRDALFMTLMWMIVLFVSILVHEFGHALTSRKLTGVNPSVKLWAMGGLAYPNTMPSRRESFWITWAGPLAGLTFFLVITLVTCLILGFSSGGRIILSLAFGTHSFLDADAAIIWNQMNLAVFQLLKSLVFINFWWSLVNLLPVFPLDGGQIYASVETSQRKVFQVGVVVGAVTAVIGIAVFKSIFIAFLFGFLAYQNYQRLQQITGGGGFR